MLGKATSEMMHRCLLILCILLSGVLHRDKVYRFDDTLDKDLSIHKRYKSISYSEAVKFHRSHPLWPLEKLLKYHERNEFLLGYSKHKVLKFYEPVSYLGKFVKAILVLKSLQEARKYWVLLDEKEAISVIKNRLISARMIADIEPTRIANQIFLNKAKHQSGTGVINRANLLASIRSSLDKKNSQQALKYALAYIVSLKHNVCCDKIEHYVVSFNFTRLVRYLIADGDTFNALRIIKLLQFSDHNLDFLKGVLLLTKEKAPERAIEFFHRAYKTLAQMSEDEWDCYRDSLPTGVLSGRRRFLNTVCYWLGYAYETLNNTQKAREFFELGSKDYDLYYGQKCHIHLGKDLCLDMKQRYSHKREDLILQMKLARVVIRIIQYQSSLYSRDDMMSFTRALGRMNIHPKILGYTMKEASKFGKHWPVIIGQALSTYMPCTDKRAYITLDIKHPYKHVISSIARQESSFQENLVAFDGGMGIMQIDPNTAKSIAKLLHLNVNNAQLTNNTKLNIVFGTKIFDLEYENFKGNIPCAIAAYNAGKGAVEKWRRNSSSEIEFIELISFAGTRFYVQKVLEASNIINTL